MQIKSKPTEKTFTLRTDPDGKATVTIRQATFRENMLRADAFSTYRRVYANRPGERDEVFETRNSARVWLKEIYITLSGAVGFVDEEGEELFRFKKGQLDMSESEFEHIFGQIDDEQLVREIHNCVVTVNPGWGEAIPLDMDQANGNNEPPPEDKQGMTEGE